MNEWKYKYVPLNWNGVLSLQLVRVTALKMKLRFPSNFSPKCNFLCFYPLCCSLFPISLFLSVTKRQVSVLPFAAVCATGSWILFYYCCIVVLFSHLFVWPAYPGQLQMLFGVIINLRNGSHADPFSNTLEMSLLLGFPYIRPPHYFNWSLRCILSLHMDNNDRQQVGKERLRLTQKIFLSAWFCSSICFGSPLISS